MATPCGLAGLLGFALMAAAASATQFRVGGDKGWSVLDATDEPYNAWAGRLRFIIGDQLLFVYAKETESVLVVDQAAYDACNTTTYVTKFEGGSTVFTFDRSGPFFFITGNQASCAASQKLIVVVLSADHTPPGLLPTPPSSMPPASSAPEPSPSSPPSPPSMAPPSAAPVPSPSSPPSMAPPSGAPMPSPMSPPSAAPMPTPESAPSPTGSAPGAAPAAAPGSPPATGSPPSSSPGTPGGVPQPPSDTTSPPGADGANSTPPGSGAAQVTAGLISTLAAGIGYAMLAI